jgi:aryl-alcohol dehydrogenase-like predicted oxidoreductase
VLPLCREHGLGFTPFGPLAGGWLTGKYRRGEAYPAGSRMTQRPDAYAHLDSNRTYDALDALRADADARGVSMSALAHAWVLSHPQVDAVVIGPNRPEQLDSAVSALDVEISADERARMTFLFA